MAEPYIKKLQRENDELIEYIKSVHSWRDALSFANTTGRKGDAFRVVDQKRIEMDRNRKIIEPLLAEKESK